MQYDEIRESSWCYGCVETKQLRKSSKFTPLGMRVRLCYISVSSHKSFDVLSMFCTKNTRWTAITHLFNDFAHVCGTHTYNLDILLQYRSECVSYGSCFICVYLLADRFMACELFKCTPIEFRWRELIYSQFYSIIIWLANTKPKIKLTLRGVNDTGDIWHLSIFIHRVDFLLLHFPSGFSLFACN